MGELTRLMLRLSLVQHRVWAAAGGGCWRLYEDTEQAADPALA